jgi:5-methylcytosine-specific restriction enzyme subunit McrC
MSPIPLLDETPAIVVEMAEWETVGLAQNPRLARMSFDDNVSARHVADALRSSVDIREEHQGLKITSNSFVGRIDVGQLRISIRPKLAAKDLARLLRYAYGLRDLAIREKTTAPTVRHGLHDLLIAMLAAEIEELLHRGLVRRYIPQSERLESPRGRILVEELICRGGLIEARLPCRHFERHTDWQLNQVLRGGLDAAAQMTEDRDLRRRVRRLAEMFYEVERKTRIDVGDIDQAERGLTRLTDACAPALRIIRLLFDMLGFAFQPDGLRSPIPGFLFDMNRFFQRLLSRFLHENLLGGKRIVDERAIPLMFAYAPDANPRHHAAPKPRPDYALLRGHVVEGFLDAKYRDVWEKGYPAEWLYQLAIYALASQTRVSAMLYASMALDARDEQVDIRPPWSSEGPASVIFRPVALPQLAELLNPDKAGSLAAAERRKLAEKLVVLRKSEPARASDMTYKEA